MSKHSIKLLSGLGLSLLFSCAAAGPAITAIQLANGDGDQQVLQIRFDGPAVQPNSFAIANPPRIAFDFSPTLTVGGTPALDTKKVNTQVLVENGGTVVIGGIYQQQINDTVNKVPLLGDIPILGALFRSSQKYDNRTELLVFITPRVVDDLSGDNR